MVNKKISDRLNLHCLCKTLDNQELINQLSKELDYSTMISTRPHLFSATAIYISHSELENIQHLIETIEEVIHSKSFKEQVLNGQNLTQSKGVFMGYDFHLTKDGPKLIEINTNAGGAYLNLILARAQVACCDGVRVPLELDHLEESFVNMFKEEWRLERNGLPLKTIAIVDDNPTEQYLYPEFQLFASLFKKHGLECYILDPSQIEFKNNSLWFGDKKIDLIYNRLTDFYFESEKNILLKMAYESRATVFTPAPFHHTLYADKKNLELLSNADKLSKLCVADERKTTLLTGIPTTTLLSHLNHDDFWKNKKDYFFKPTKGFGSKATYRGDKLTTRVWNEIKMGNYVAQRIAPPGLRVLIHDNEQTELKVDLRAYTYDGKIQLLGCRLYSGQTTNFRTPGGGFAPVFLI
jgi:hypothetical protein